MSQKIRKRTKEAVGRIETAGGQRQTRFNGRDMLGSAFAFTAAA